MEQITIDSGQYKQNKSLPDCTIKKPLERIKELCSQIHYATNDSQVTNVLQYLRIEIDRLDKTLCEGKELPF